MYEHMMNNQEHIKNAKEHLRTFKHIQENLNNYYHTLILNSHHGSTKKQIREIDYIFMQDSYSGGEYSW